MLEIDRFVNEIRSLTLRTIPLTASNPLWQMEWWEDPYRVIHDGVNRSLKRSLKDNDDPTILIAQHKERLVAETVQAIDRIFDEYLARLGLVPD